MTDEYIIAYIGAAATIFSTVLGVVLTKNQYEWRNYFIKRPRRKMVDGTWKGTVVQTLPDNTIISYQVELILKVARKSVTGVGKVYFNNNLTHVELIGGFRNDNYLRLDYENKDPSIVQFGALIFRLSSTSKKLTGKLIGYGHVFEQIIYGSAEFEKE